MILNQKLKNGQLTLANKKRQGLVIDLLLKVKVWVKKFWLQPLQNQAEKLIATLSRYLDEETALGEEKFERSPPVNATKKKHKAKQKQL